MMAATARVRRIWNHPAHAGTRPAVYPPGREVPGAPIRRAWAILRDGIRLPYLVVDCQPGLTIIDDHTPYKLRTTWHAGIGPGDLARRYLPMIEAQP